MNSENKIKEFYKFEKGWNGYDANPIDKEVITKALYLDKWIPFETDVFPTAANSVQFEFETDNHYLEIEVKSDKVTIYENFNENEVEKDVDFDTKGIIEILNNIKLFFKDDIKNIALFSGAFNPPTKAHYHVMKKIIEKSPCDIVAIALGTESFVSRKMSKSKESFYYSEDDRLYMMLKMTYKNKDIVIYGIEDGYTFDVLNNVKNRLKTADEDKLKDATIYFVAGSDKILEMKRWGHSKELLNNFGFIILTRGDEEEAKKNCEKTYKKYTLIDTSVYKEVSSTIVRNKIKNNENIDNLVTEDVKKAIDILKLKLSLLFQE